MTSTISMWLDWSDAPLGAPRRSKVRSSWEYGKAEKRQGLSTSTACQLVVVVAGAVFNDGTRRCCLHIVRKHTQHPNCMVDQLTHNRQCIMGPAGLPARRAPAATIATRMGEDADFRRGRLRRAANFAGNNLAISEHDLRLNHHPRPPEVSAVHSHWFEFPTPFNSTISFRGDED